MPNYDYRCSRNHLTEAIRSMDCTVIGCGVCGSPAVRQAAYRVAVVAPSVDTRSMTRRYLEATAELDHKATALERNGQSVTTPSYWQAAKKRANAMIAAGEAPPLRKE